MAIFSGLATAIGGLLGGTFLSGAVGSFLIKAAVGIGLNLLASSLAGEPEKASFSVQGQLQAGGDISRSFILGQTATAGSLVYANTWGAAGKTPNAYFTQVIALSDLPMRGIARVWVNGERCTLLTDSAHAEYGWPVQEYRVNGTDYLWVKFYDGTQTTADSFLVQRVSTAERPYQSTRVGVGVSYAICTARISDTLFTGFPSYKFEVLGARLYDITKDSTAGGSGTQRLDNPATWGGDGDDLPAVHVHNLILGLRYGSEWFYGLQGVTAVRTPSANWRAQIAKCRAGVDKPGGGTETRYLAGLEVQVNAPVADAVEAFLSACQGRLIDSGGFYNLRVGAPDAAVFSFSDGDILSTEEQSFSPFFGLADTVNGISATYPEPEEGWNSKAAPSLYRPDLEARDGNRRLLANVELGAVSRSSQVQRLIKSALEEARRARRHTISLGPSAWVLEPGDVIAWTSARNGYAAKLMRIDGVVDKANLDVVLDLTEVDPSDYDWNPSTDYKTPTYGFLGPARPLPQDIVDWFAAPAIIEDTAGNARRPAIRLSWDGSVDDVSAVTFNVRLAATGEIVYRGRTDQVAAGAILISQNLLPAEDYQAQGRYVPNGERLTVWGGWLPVTTPDVRLTDRDVYLPGMIDDLLARLDDLHAWLGDGTRDLIDGARRNVLLDIEADVGRYTQSQTIRQEVTSTAEGVSAKAATELLAATGPGSTIAQNLLKIEAAINDPTKGLAGLASGLVATTARVTVTENTLLVLSQDLVDLGSVVQGKASSDALQLLQTQVTTQGDEITATSNALTALDTTVGKFSASGRFRVTTEATPAGASARIGLSVSATAGGTTSTAAIFLDAIAGGLSRVVINADQFAIVNGTAVEKPFIVSGGVVRMNVAHIGTVTAGVIKSPDDMFILTVATGKFEWFE